MVLSNSKISELVNKKNLLTNYNSDSLQYSSYRLRIGKLFIPEEGRVLESNKENVPNKSLDKIRILVANIISPKHYNIKGSNLFANTDKPYILKSREIVLFQTIEEVNMPDDIMATYSALNTIASQGILLINASMIEPKYNGPLSGILMNFSNTDFEIFPKMPIAKISFFRIDGRLDDVENVVERNNDGYSKKLSERARKKYTKTFLSINQFGDEIEKRISKTIKKDVLNAGIILTILLAFATLQPYFYACIWGTSVFDNDAWQKNVVEQKYYKNEKRTEKINIRLDSIKNKK